MLPNAHITKADFATGGAPPSSIGILAIIAASATGTYDAPAAYARDNLALTDLGAGPLVEYFSLHVQVAKKPAVLNRCHASIPGSYGAITSTASGGTSAVTADNVVLPADENHVIVAITGSGTIGVTGITYTITKDGGKSVSGKKALGTDNFIQDVSAGIKLNLGAGTLVAGATYEFFTKRPIPNDSDLVASLQAMKVTRLAWEGVLVDAECGTATAGLLDTWLGGLEDLGQFKFALLNTRHKTEPCPTAETEAAYATVVTSIVQNQATIRACVGVDAGDYVSTLTGVSQPRPVSLFLGARAMLIPVGEDPAFVGRGNLPGVQISDGSGNPRWHDEELYPGLDDQRVVTLRSFAPGGPSGVYINNANVLSPNGSDYKWLQHIRVINLACTIAWQRLAALLSLGVQTTDPDPQQGNKIFITETDAQRVESFVNGGFSPPLDKQVKAVGFALSRTDDLSSNSASKVHGTVKVVAKRYLKDFEVEASFAKTIAVAA